jgi:glycosyltransferase involved in cell wall biosynthesis
VVSVIIPTHDRAQLAVRAIDSVLAQTYADLEVIVVDDGSTDGSAEVIAERYGDDDRVVYVWQAQSGVAGARNTGLARARGELLAFLDSDDVWCPEKLALQLACLERVPEAGMIWTDMHLLDLAGNTVPGSSLGDILNLRWSWDELFAHQAPLRALGVPEELGEAGSGHLFWGDIFAAMVVGNLVLPSAAVMTRARVESVGPYDETVQVAGEDFDYFLRTCRAGPVAFIDVATVLKQGDRPDQLTHPSRRLHLARNYIHTMEGALSRDAARIDLAPEVILDARAYGHAWTGQAYLESGEPAGARRHLRRSLRLRPADPRTLLLLGLALLPGPVVGSMLMLARRLRARLRRG